MNRTSRPLPDYELYGEPEGSGFPDTLHIEHLSVRSGPRRWRIARHRHPSLHQLFWIERGGGALIGEDGETTLAASSFLNMPAGVAHGFRFLPGSTGTVLTLPVAVFEPIRARIDPQGELLGVRIGRARTAPPELEALLAEQQGSRANRGEALAALATLTFVWALRLLAAEPQAGPEAGAGSAAVRLAARFQALVDAHYREWHALAPYAAALAVTTPHLTRACRQALGRPASAVLRERQMLEARRLLAYTQGSVADVAYWLGFADPGHFSRVFTAAAGLSPRAFRKEFTYDAA
ncbi:helix-turn-helix domain-containing protein [Stappia indica]|uniref:Transcriptional regulator, AraC family n=1 Tax=Stappia indica TaxID=538381 RepID=A0A285S1Q2_9HYPH|nr:helix-turn-helix domain-containing protein [Stappia indica]SOC00843.1 transcriptional regulator, AraC family [Stappia indica]